MIVQDLLGKLAIVLNPFTILLFICVNGNTLQSMAFIVFSSRVVWVSAKEISSAICCLSVASYDPTLVQPSSCIEMNLESSDNFSNYEIHFSAFCYSINEKYFQLYTF